MERETSLKTTGAAVASEGLDPVLLDERTGMQVAPLRQAIVDHLLYSVGRSPEMATQHDYYRALALAVRDRLQYRWIKTTTQTHLELGQKVAAYMSAEFLIGPQLG